MSVSDNYEIKCKISKSIGCFSPYICFECANLRRKRKILSESLNKFKEPSDFLKFHGFELNNVHDLSKTSTHDYIYLHSLFCLALRHWFSLLC